MAYYRRKRSYSRSSRASVGQRAAQRHIAEAEDLSKQLGGTDVDVKDYFYSLPKSVLDSVFKTYGEKHGSKAQLYAIETFPKWKTGKRHMSGLVASRLYELLPATMPTQKKYALVESLWKHVGPSSYKIFYVGPDADIEEVSLTIKRYMENVVVDYKIPKSMEGRYDWLSQGDVVLKQQLLNHFRQKEIGLVNHSLNNNLPILLDHLSRDSATGAIQELKVGRHKVTISITDKVTGITDKSPIPEKSVSNIESNNNWLFWAIAIGVLLLVFN
ncbi:hypothetical protein OAS86_06980 [Gammaproteobacteria bacterium]|nr:hypothetical protein [Gammaproteobacteria bacterium]